MIDQPRWATLTVSPQTSTSPPVPAVVDRLAPVAPEDDGACMASALATQFGESGGRDVLPDLALLNQDLGETIDFVPHRADHHRDVHRVQAHMTLLDADGRQRFHGAEVLRQTDRGDDPRQLTCGRVGGTAGLGWRMRPASEAQPYGGP